MESVCPNCKKKTEHEDFLFEVVCGCGSRYNPFMQEDEAPGGQSGALEPEPASGGGQPAPAAAETFTESAEAFQELRDFGETLAPDGSTPAASGGGLGAEPAASTPKPRAKAAASIAATSGEPGDECPMTGGDSLPGYQIEAYYMPVSASGEVDAGGDDPLHAAFANLWQQARNSGGNGLVSMRWVLSSDGGKVFASGTPVKCARG